VRAALCYDKSSARNSREHNHANVLLPGGLPLTLTQPETIGSCVPVPGVENEEIEKANFTWTPKS
jgi:hypothetical protein